MRTLPAVFNKTRIICYPLFLLPAMILTASSVSAQMFRQIESARLPNVGAMSLQIGGSFYRARDLYTTVDGQSSAIIVWDSYLFARLSYCFSPRLQLEAAPVVLQSTHVQGKADNLPGNIDLFAKTPLLAGRKLAVSLQGQVRIPTAERQNVPLYEYSSGTVGFGGAGSTTLKLFGSSPDKGGLIDLNFGYFFHNDRGRHLTDLPNETLMAKGTQQLYGGAALRLLGANWGGFAEVRSVAFLESPPVTAYGREDALWGAIGLIYRVSPFLQLDFKMDRRLSRDIDNTLYAAGEIKGVPKPWHTLPNYPDWRIQLGVSLQLREGKTVEAKPKEAEQPKEQQEPKQKSQEKARPRTPKKEKETKSQKPGIVGSVTDGQQEKEIDLGDVKELERRWRLLQEAGAESVEQRLERMQRERERMNALLQQLRQRLAEQAEAKRAAEEAARAEEEAKRAAEEARKAQEAQRQELEKSSSGAAEEATSREESLEKPQLEEPPKEVGTAAPSEKEEESSGAEAPQSQPPTAETLLEGGEAPAQSAPVPVDSTGAAAQPAPDEALRP
ncbi:MAG: hypothetical protein ONB24_11625 [candidate division KSB1 bacterium]|nr:hypothetical protein [candidate division KSB1 bacterium]